MMTFPVRFTGTEEERAANRATHNFFRTGGHDDYELRCGHCDAKPWHAAAEYPCGTEPPRTNGETCRWFALCDHPATGTAPGPGDLGPIPVCDRCRTRLEIEPFTPFD
jgi:hypothetical protein